MKKIILSIIVLCLLIPGVLGIVNYSVYNYGDGQYGSNTPPTIITYTPTDLVTSYNTNATVDFNLTFVDYDGDTLYLYWYYNNTLNSTNENATIKFNESGIFNVTGNVTDTYDDTITSWYITISALQVIENVTDVVIIPYLIPSGSLITVVVNATSTKNLTNVYAYLNADEDFEFLSDTPQNQSIGSLWTTNITKIKWFVASPLSSKKYAFNVTYVADETYEGTNENTYVTQAGNDNMLLGMIVFIPLFIAAFLLVLSWLLPPEKYWALKISLPFIGLFFVYQAYQYGAMMLSEFYGSNAIIDAIGENSFIYGMVIWVLVAILIITIIYDVFMLFSQKKKRTGDYE